MNRVYLRGRCVAMSPAMVMANGNAHTSGNCGLDSGPSHHADLPILRLETATATWQSRMPTQLADANTRHGRLATTVFTALRVVSNVVRLPTNMARSLFSVPHFSKLSIFFPMWNEEQYILRALNAGHDVARELMASGEVGDYELIVVNDASTDATAQLADEAAASNPRVRVVHHPANRKLGGSMKSGFAAATGDVIVYTDADLPFDMLELHKALRLLRTYEADIASAYRFDRTDEGLTRVVYSSLYNGLVRVLFGVRVRDVNFAFKVCRASVFNNIVLKSEGSFIDAELIVRAKKLGHPIVQFGVDYFPRTRGVSTLSSPSVIVKILREAFALRRELNAIKPIAAS